MSKPEIILCDIDGTIADCEHRRRYIDDVIRTGDTVYVKGMPNSKVNPGKVTWQFEGNDESGEPVEYQGVTFKFPIHMVTSCLAEALIKPGRLRKKKDYKKFFEAAANDPPLQTTIDVIKTLGMYTDVMFCSGRPEDYRELTQAWLDHNSLGRLHYFDYDSYVPRLFMRPSGDMRPDHVVKKELYLTHIEPYYKVKCVFDDRQRVVDMWRSLGLQCYQVAEGKF